jgi:hypothetical protein
MKESVLKKEFKEADLQRLRNLVQGKTGEKTSVSSGYTKETIDNTQNERPILAIKLMSITELVSTIRLKDSITFTLNS